MSVTIADRPTFGTPPEPIVPPGGTPGRWDNTVDELRQRPNEWAAIATIPARSSLGKTKETLARRGLEVMQRSNRDGTATIWARYVGTANVPAPVKRTSYRATPGVMHHLDLSRPNMPGPLVWAPPAEAAS